MKEFDIIDKYKKLNLNLDEIYNSIFGRCERHNIDVKNTNPTEMLILVAIMELTEEIKDLKEVLKKQTESTQKEVTQKTTKETKKVK